MSLKKSVALKSKLEVLKLKGRKGSNKKKIRMSLLGNNIQESFLITQQLEVEGSKRERMVNKPTFKIFADTKFVREKILEAIEKVKIEKKWIDML